MSNNKRKEAIERSEGDGSTSNNVVLSAPKEGRLWFQKKLAQKEDINMPAFCKEFGYTCEQDADAAFSKILTDSKLPQFCRTAAETKYRRWQRNEGEGFWASRSTDYRIDISTTKTVGDLVDRGQFFASKFLQSRPEQPTTVLGKRDTFTLLAGQKQAHNRAACRTPPYNNSFNLSSPESLGRSTPPPPVFVPLKAAQDEASHAFFTSGGSLQDIVFNNLREGRSLPSWAKDRPLYTFDLQLQDSWGLRVTELYKVAKTKSDLDYTNVDEIALLSGILHFNQKHVGFSAKEMATISAQVLQKFYSQDMEDRDMQRATDAVVLWSSWVQIWKSASLKEKLAAQKNDRDVREVDMDQVVDAIMSSYSECKNKDISSITFIALQVFRRYSNWSRPVSELDCMLAVVSPFLQEIMDIQHEIRFKCANVSTSAGKARKSSLGQNGQSRQPDVVGQARDGEEVFYGELKGLHPAPATVNTDILRLAIFTKDALDQLHNTLEQGPPLLTFQTVGRHVTFFLGAKIDNTIVHAFLSSIQLPSVLSELDLDLEFFFRLFQVQSLVAIAKSRLKNKREKPLQDTPFPTLGTPQRSAALKSPSKKTKK
ncbi:hypothetical protein BGZ67_008412 [Mortierella alpina]|nr:hypothetical protein BGZ67_008412 [Mortierella alpina]